MVGGCHAVFPEVLRQIALLIQTDVTLTFYTVFNTAMFTLFKQLADERQRNKNFILPMIIGAKMI